MITVFNTKGGVGKTTLAFALAAIYELKYTTNDYSVVLDILDDVAYEPELNADDVDNGIIDLGGFITPSIMSILEKTSVLLIPVTNDLNAIAKTNFLLEELEKFHFKIIVVASNLRKDDYKSIKKKLDLPKGMPLVKIMNSTAFTKSLEQGQSIESIIQETPLLKHAYSKVTHQIQDLIEEIDSI